ncbi:hypothetical protein ACMV8I_03225 [Ewingella sp. S1.OA.A_B6]
MVFKTDSGGFAFKCDDAKFSISASTWSTRLSQIGTAEGTIRIVTNKLSNIGYIEKILDKRPYDIHIIAHTDARENAVHLKKIFPEIKIALHNKINAKVVFIEPNIIWLASSDFGESKMIESAIGLHSLDAHQQGIENYFEKLWYDAEEL